MIDSFRGEFRFLSNFYPVQIPWEGETWPSVEHAYQAEKCRDKKSRAGFLQGITAAGAKALGRVVQIRDDWEEVKLSAMKTLLRIKFAKDTSLAHKLLATGDEELVEGNLWHDNFWGCCVCPGCNEEGKNHLGKLLMKIREELKG